MVVSVLHFIIDLPPLNSLKEKRQIVQSLKERMQRRFKLSVAEVDLQDSLYQARLGAALVSNSRTFGESVLHKVLQFAEENSPGRIRDIGLFSEFY